MKVAFRNLFSLAADSNGLVVNFFDETINSWSPSLHVIGRLLELFEGTRPNPSSRDNWVWTLSKKGKFTPKSLYWELRGFTVRTFPLMGIWTPGILSKVAFFMWTVYLDKLSPLTTCRAEVEI